MERIYFEYNSYGSTGDTRMIAQKGVKLDSEVVEEISTMVKLDEEKIDKEYLISMKEEVFEKCKIPTGKQTIKRI